jgi:hypothetical protein
MTQASSRESRLLSSGVLVALMGLCGCGGGDETAGEGPVEEECLAPARVVDERCVEPGVADNGCPAGTLFTEADGSCRPAGMLATDCSEGFAHDGGFSCAPILPSEPCLAGSMAVPGDDACRPVMECGSGKWGNIPVDAATEHVDGGFVGTSNGSATAPWSSIGDAVVAAAPGALIAIAAGSYMENVVVVGKPVRLHGVCPELVEVVGTTANPPTCPPAAICITVAADATEVRGLAVRGAVLGVALSGAQQVMLDQLWVHDTGGRGILLQDDAGPTSVTIRGSLVEGSADIGVYVSASEAHIEASVVRDTQPIAIGGGGRGINVQPDPQTGAPSLVTVTGSLIERNSDLGVFMQGSQLELLATVVRDTAPAADGVTGRGVGIQPDPTTGAPSLATIRGSLLERNHEIGLMLVGSTATVESTVIRDTLPNAEGVFARGIYVRNDPMTGAPSSLTLRGAVLARNQGGGISLDAAEALVETTVIQDTTSQVLFGRAINLQPDFTTGAPSSITLRGSFVEGSMDLGLVAYQSTVVVESSAIVRTTPNIQGIFGDGLSAVHGVEGLMPTTMVIEASLIEDSARAGVSNFGSSVFLSNSVVGCASFQLAGEPSAGLSGSYEDGGGNACGCPAAGECKVISAGLSPPEIQTGSE